MEPVVVTPEKDAIEGLPRISAPAIHDMSPLETGRHALCGGTVTFHPVNQTQKALHCVTCGLRVTFPSEVSTWQDLRNHFGLHMMRQRQQARGGVAQAPPQGAQFAEEYAEHVRRNAAKAMTFAGKWTPEECGHVVEPDPPKSAPTVLDRIDAKLGEG